MPRTDFLAPISLKLAAGSAARGEIAGYASTFGGEADSHGDLIARNAYAKTLRKRKADGTMPALLWHHHQDVPIGKWQVVREDATGLYVEGKLTLGTQFGREAYELAKDDALYLSIGYNSVKSRRTDAGRLLEEIDLHEISVVSMPSNRSARITSVKSGELDDLRDIEPILRQCGLSRREAKLFMLAGKGAIARPDPKSNRRAELARAIKAAAAALQE